MFSELLWIAVQLSLPVNSALNQNAQSRKTQLII